MGGAYTMINPHTLLRRWRHSVVSDDLRIRRDALESAIDSLGRWMIGFTAVVVVGLVTEWSQPTFSLFRVHDIGGVLVTIGVAGELAVEYVARRKEQTLRAVNAEIENESDLKLKAADERIAG